LKFSPPVPTLQFSYFTVANLSDFKLQWRQRILTTKFFDLLRIKHHWIAVHKAFKPKTKQAQRYRAIGERKSRSQISMKTNKPADDINSISLASIEPDSETAAFIAQIEAKRDYYHTCINGGY